MSKAKSKFTSGPSALQILLQVLRRFGPHLQAHRRVLVGAVAMLLLEITLRLVEPWVLKVVFDVLLVPNPTRFPAGARLLEMTGPATLLVGLAVGVVVLAGLRAYAAFSSSIGFARAGSAVLGQVRAELFSHMQSMSLGFHQRSRGGDLVLRVINDVSLLQDVLVTALVPLLARTTILIGMAAVMFWLNWQLAALAVAVLPLFWLRGRSLSRRIHETARDQRRREGALAATAAESFGSVQVVQALSLGDRFLDAFRRRNQKASREDVKGRRLAASLERSVDVCIAVATALVLWQGTRLVWAGQLTAGDLLVFLAYLKTAFRPLQDTAKYTGRLAKAAAAADRVLEVLDQDAGVKDLPGAVPAPAWSGNIRFEGVTYLHATRDGTPGGGIRDVTVAIPAGALVALVGASGSGKSTLLSLLARLHDPTAGSVRVDGEDIRRWTIPSVRGQVGFVLQDTGLFAASVRENLVAGVAGVTDAEVEAAARLARAHEFIMALPEGYETVLGERGVTLSQGQRQRLAVARAALRRTPVLLLDEPTAGLDDVNARAVFEALRELARGRTTLLVTHDLRQAAVADLVLVVQDGRVVEHGRPDDLLRGGGPYAAMQRQTTTPDAPAAGAGASITPFHVAA